MMPWTSRVRLLIATGVALTISMIVPAAMLAWDKNAQAETFGLCQGLLYAVAAWLLLTAPSGGMLRSRGLIIVIIGLGLVMRLMLVWLPADSTDIYRYVWDGRVQNAGVNPYSLVPADPALTALRDSVIYPNINRADYARTIYPPAAEMFFLVVTRVTESVVGMKVAMVSVETIGILVMLSLLRRWKQPLNRILLYIWHPLPVREFAGSGHIDVLAMTLMLLAILAAERKSPWLAGLALAAGSLVKYLPVVIAPAIWRRWDARMTLGFLLSVGLLYLPYLGAGSKVFGFLPGYFDEEGLRAGSGIYLLSLISEITVLPPWTSTAYFSVGAALLLAIGLHSARRPDSNSFDLRAAALLYTMFLIVVSPHYAWYFTSLVPFVCLLPSASLIWLTAAAPLVDGLGWQLPMLPSQSIFYGIFACLFLYGVYFSRHRPPYNRPFMEIANGSGPRSTD
jgi:alpha-1,6-mannosyltransferase